MERHESKPLLLSETNKGAASLNKFVLQLAHERILQVFAML